MTTTERARQEAEVIAGLDRMHWEDPAAFDEMMEVLARLVVTVPVEEK